MLEAKTSWSIRYVLDGDARERSLSIDGQGYARPAAAAGELGISIVTKRRDGHVAKRAVIRPARAVRVTSISVTLPRRDVLGADAVFLNGYNSWTDSVERHPLAPIRGLQGIPKSMVERWVLDNSGDYRFVRQSCLPGAQHGMGYGYLRFGARVLLFGSLDEDSGFTVVRASAWTGALKLEKEPPARRVRAGEELEICSFALCTGSLDEAFSRYAELYGAAPRPAPALVGYTSWYRHYGAISEDKLMHDLAATAALYANRELGPCRAVFQIDDGYAKVGDWLEPDAARFPCGMEVFPAACAASALVPGLWLAPFLAEQESRLAAEHPDWLLRDAHGEPVAAGGNWSGAWALDTRNPHVRAHIARVMDVVTRGWGYKLLKLDFLFAACLEPHDGMNRGQLMADALDLLRVSVPQGTWFDLCGVPLMSAFGRTEFCRIGCDVGLDWDDTVPMRLLHRERVSTKRSLANTKGRAHLDRVVFRNDPDVFFLRGDVKLTRAQRSKLLNADAALGGVFLTSDDVSAWDEEQRRAFDAALAAFVSKEA